MSENRSFLRGLSELHDIGAWIGALIILVIIGIGYLITSPFFEYVSDGEVVVEDCDGVLEIWRGGRDNGPHWDGTCETVTYSVLPTHDLFLIAAVDGVDVQVHVYVSAQLPDNDESMRALHKAHHSESSFMNNLLNDEVRGDLRAAVRDPSWHIPKGGILKRNLKRALDYTLRRVSPLGTIWSSPEARRSLESEMQRRLDARAFPYGVHPTIRIYRITER